MTTYFLRTVPEVTDPQLSTAAKLKVTVNNTGNYFFERAVTKQLADYKTIDRLSELPRGEDTLILSMSNFLSPATDLGWFADQLEATQVKKIVMIGAGAQAESFADAIHLTDGTTRFVKLLSEKSESIGVRGYYTADVLSRIGVKNVDVIGCPSLFFNCERNFQITKANVTPEKPKTVIHFTPSGHYRDAISHLLSFGVREAIGYIAQSETHLNYEDESVEDKREYFFKYFNDGTYTPEQLNQWMKKSVKWFFDLETWFKYMSAIDFAVGARFHGNMAALQVGVPALNLVFDTRTRELCEYLNLPFQFLKDFEGRISAKDLYEQTDYSLFNRTYSFKYDAYRSFLERNGVSHNLGAVDDTEVERSEGVRFASVIELLKSCEASGVSSELIANDLIRRLELDRNSFIRKQAERGKFDNRTGA